MPRDYLDYGLPPSQMDIMRQIARRQAATPDPVRPFNIRRGLAQGAEGIDPTMPTVEMPKPITPFDVLGATSSATGRAMGSLVDKPGNVHDAVFEAAKGVRDALSGKGVTSPSIEMQKRAGVETPGVANFMLDAFADVGNVADPMKMFLPVAGMAAHTGEEGVGALLKRLRGALANDEAARKIGGSITGAAEKVLPKVESATVKAAEETVPKAASKIAPKPITPSFPKEGGQGNLFGAIENPVEEELAHQGNLFAKMPPEIQQAGQQAHEVVRKSAKDGKLANVLAQMGKSNLSVIRDSGRTGPQLAQLLERTRLDADRLGALWEKEARDATAGLSKDQIAEYVKARDVGAISTDPAVAEALQKRSALDQKIAQHIEATGAELKVRGQVVDSGNWPRVYEEKFFHDKDTVINKLMDQGLTPDQAEKAYARSHNMTQRLIDPTTGKQMEIPGYRTDLPADYMHLNDEAKRVVNARAFGPKDISDPTSPLSALIRGTDDPARVAELVKRHLGKESPATSQKALNSVIRGAIKVQSALHLSQFALSNMSNAANVLMRSNTDEFVKALGKTATKWSAATGEAAETGALQTIRQDILREVGGESWMSKMYGMKASETFNRTVAALAGKGTAESLFRQLKEGKGSATSLARARARLENLILEPHGSLMKQDALTPEQLARAGGRMSEITQGRAQSIDLPKLWSEHPAADVITLFKKYSFRQTKIIRDAIKENPGRNIPLLLALYGATGEVVGDAKASIKGLSSGKGPGQEIKDRGKGLDRLAANLGQSWAFGILADVLEGTMENPAGFTQYAGGPIVGDVSQAGYNVLNRNGPGLVRQGLRSVPYIGSGLAERVPKKGGKKDKASLPRLGATLPKLPRL